MYFSHKKYNFHGIRILEREIKCCQLADDTTIFVRDSSEVKNVIGCLNTFSLVSGLNLNKCELFPLKNGQSIGHSPVAQWLEHCVSSAKVVSSFPRKHMY